MTKIATFILFTLVSSLSFSQESLKATGRIQGADLNVKSKKMKKTESLSEVQINIFDNDQLVESLMSDEKGDYEIFLREDFIYKIEFLKEGYISKIIQISTHDLPVAILMKGFEIETDIRLIKQMDGLDFSSYSKLPVAKCAYNSSFEDLTWDMKYAEQAYSTFLSIVENTTAVIFPDEVQDFENEESSDDWLEKRFKSIMQNLIEISDKKKLVLN